MFSYPIDVDCPFDQNPYFNNRRRRYYNPHQACAYSYPSYTHPQSFSNFHIPQNRYFQDPYHLRESYYDPENIVNLVSGLNQINEEEKNHDKERKRNGHIRVKISGPEDERENKHENKLENKHENKLENKHENKPKNYNSFTKQQAAKKVYNFLKHQPSIHKTRKILVKLLHLRNIQNQLNSLSSQNQSFGTLTFSSKDAGKQILPISKNNKMFLMQEDAILKIFDQLDKVQSEGNEIIRDRRKEIVKIAQKMLEKLDAEKDRQWKLFFNELENSESIENKNNESTENENNESIEKENSESTENDENNKSIENIDNTEDIVIDDDIEKNDGEKDIVNEEVIEDAIIERIEDDKEEMIIDEVINTLNNSSETEEIKPYTILSHEDTKSVHTGDDEKDFDFIDNTVSDSNSSTNFNEEIMDAREPLIVVDNNLEESNEAVLAQIKEVSQQDITSPMESVENMNVTNEESEDEFVIVNTSN